MQLNKDCQGQIIKFAIKEQFEVLTYYNRDSVFFYLKYQYGRDGNQYGVYCFDFNLVKHTKKAEIEATKIKDVKFLVSIGRGEYEDKETDILYWIHKRQGFCIAGIFGFMFLPNFLNDIIFAILTFFSDPKFLKEHHEIGDLKLDNKELKVKFVDMYTRGITEFEQFLQQRKVKFTRITDKAVVYDDLYKHIFDDTDMNDNNGSGSNSEMDGDENSQS